MSQANRTGAAVIKKTGEPYARPPSNTSSTASARAMQQQESANSSSMRQVLNQLADDPKAIPNKQSSYKGQLASEKHFTPQELNKLHLKSNASYKKPITKEELKKIGAGQRVAGQSTLQGGGPSTSSLSYISGSNADEQQDYMASSKGMSQEQQSRLKNLTSRPFSVKSTSSRPGTASSQIEDFNQKENQYALEDDVYEEISIPDVDFEERMKLLQQLDRRERDREELESVYEELKSKADVNDEMMETMTNMSMQEMKEEKKVNIYKPTLKKQGNGVQMQAQSFYPQLTEQSLDDSTDRIKFPPQQQSSFLQQSIMQSSKIPTSLVPLPMGQDGQTRLDHIYKQLKELQQFKDEIMDDLDEFMDDVETNSLITIPEQQFEDVVDIIAQESRERGEQVVEMQENNRDFDQISEAATEVLDENGKPFWMKFFKADYLAETEPKPDPKATKDKNSSTQQQRISEILQKQEKIRREFEKIRKLDAELAQKTKFQRELKNAQMARRQDEDEVLRRQVELAQPPKQPSKKEEDKKSSKKKPTTQATKGGRPQKQEEDEDAGDTFLTDMMTRKRSGSQASSKKPGFKKGAKGKIEEQDDEDDVESDELQDVVYDYEQTQAMMEAADDFLHQPLLSLPAPGDDKSPSKNRHNQSQISFKSNMTGMTNMSNKNFLQMNKERAANFNPYKKPMICDTLDEASRSRLQMLTEDIDNDLDDYIKKKDEFYAIEMEKSQYGPITDANNAYLYSKEDVDRIERINESLRKVTPMLPPAEGEGSVMGSEYKPSKLESHFDHSKFLSSQHDDKQSMRSLPMSTITRKSQVTMLTHGTIKTGITNAALPRDRKLREAAQDRILKAQMRDIEANLRRLTESDDLSYATPALKDGPPQNASDSKGFQYRDLVQPKKLIDNDTLQRLIEECREEDERFSIMQEMQDEYQPTAPGLEENRLQLRSAAPSERSVRELAKLDKQDQLLTQADELFIDLENTKDRYMQVLNSVNERENSIKQLETRVNKLFKATESQIDSRKKKQALKNKLNEFEQEIKDILTNLDGKEHLLAVIQQQEQRLEQEFQNSIVGGAPISSAAGLAGKRDLDEAQSDQNMQRILNDIEDYNRLQADVEREERDHNQNVLDQVQKVQEGRDDQVNEMERFAKEQIELYRLELEKEASEK